MDAPVRFVERLKSLFDNRLRVRWSNAREEWHIEQQIARGHLTNMPVRDDDDELIRARDGYAFVLAIRSGDRMPCPVCGAPLKVPVLRFGEATCGFCQLRGKDGRYPAGMFPLDGDMVLDHLKKLDPMRGYRDGLAEMLDARNAALEAARERDFSDTIQAATLENYNKMVGIPQWGYTGKEKMWLKE